MVTMKGGIKMTKNELLEKINESKANSAWKKGVKTYATMMADTFDTMPNDASELKSMCLNGAQDFEQASYGGNFFIYDSDICETLCPPSVIKRTHHGERYPNGWETWLDVQARAAFQAYLLLKRLMF
jgi:hypothetical protein